MKTRKVDADLDQDILTGMIVSTNYLKAAIDIYKPDYLMAPFAVTVAGWCIDYFKEYNTAPMQHIKDIFRSKERDGMPDDKADTIQAFLETLSTKYEQADKFNVEYLLDQTELLFRKRGLKCLTEDVDTYLSQGDLEEAEHTLNSFKLPERMKVCGTPFHDEASFQAAFEAREHPLFELPGALGKLLNPHMIPGGFVAFLGREKIGKTWILMELKKYALSAHNNVAMFQLGDLTENEYRVRQGVHYGGKSNDPRYCGEINVPVLDCLHNQQANCPIGNFNQDAMRNEKGELFEGVVEQFMGTHVVCPKCHKCKKFTGTLWWTKREAVEPLNWKEASDAVRIFQRRHKIGKFKLSVHSNSSMNVKKIENILDLWEAQDEFVPRIIFLDYPDIMLPEDYRTTDKREQENERWKAIRRLSQERHALVIVVTQRNWMDANAETATGEHVSEDKRKLAHVTAFFSLNQTDEENVAGLLRVAPISAGIREGASNPNMQVVILQCLQIGKPVVDSYWQYKSFKKSGK
jgi:hypothetical protein